MVQHARTRACWQCMLQATASPQRQGLSKQRPAPRRRSPVLRVAKKIKLQAKPSAGGSSGIAPLAAAGLQKVAQALDRCDSIRGAAIG